MIRDPSGLNFTFDLPEPEIKKHTPPADFVPFDQYPELRGVCALDFETDDPGLQAGRGSSWAIPGEGFVCGASVAWHPNGPQAPKESFYVGIQHSSGNSDPDKFWRWLDSQALKPDVTFVYANAIYDLGFLWKSGIEPINAPIDVQGMATLLDEHRNSYSLDSLLASYLGRRKGTKGLKERAKDIGIFNPLANMKRLPTWIAAPYGIDDAQDTLDLYWHFLPLMEQQDLMRVFALERECLLVGRDLRAKGVRVDIERAQATRRDFEQKRDAAAKFILDTTGVAVDAWDNAAIAQALRAENPQLELPRTMSGKESIRQAVIESLGTPCSQAVIRMRKLDKAISTFFAGHIESHLARDGRIHADFNPTRRTRDEEEGGGNVGAGPGRWSCSGPNLQNIPRRDPEIGPAIRRCFLPEEGEEWGKLDYSSQEPRLTCHFAYETYLMRDRLPRSWRNAMNGVEHMVRAYNDNPDLSMHKEVAKEMGIDIKADPRTYDMVKALNLGIIYGMQGKKFCQTVGLPTKMITTRSGKVIEVAGDEGQAMMDKHGALFPWIKGIQEFATWVAEQRGYVTTVLGRRARFEMTDGSGRPMFSYKALNSKVQGSAADQMKLAQIEFRKAGILPLVVVHDDANISLPKGEAGQRRLARAQEIMAGVLKLHVPSTSESKIGATWGDV